MYKSATVRTVPDYVLAKHPGTIPADWIPREGAWVHKTATIAEGVSIAPGCRFAPGVSIAPGCDIAGGVSIAGWCTLGANSHVEYGRYQCITDVGSRRATLLVTIEPDGRILCHTGCATSVPLDEFAVRCRAKHGANEHGRRYESVLAGVRAWAQVVSGIEI